MASLRIVTPPAQSVWRYDSYAMDSLEILETLCLQPAVSYHEHRVAREIANILAANSIEAQRDRWGNIIARLDGDSSISPLVFVAHMDHPGFEAIEAFEVNEDEEVIIAEPRGGLGFRAYERGTAVHVIGRNGVGLHGTIEARENLRRMGRFARADKVTIRPDATDLGRKASDLLYPATVILDLPSFSTDGEFIHGRQLDDLAGCATILSALIKINADGSNRRSVIGLFTRAEEVGLVGAALAAGDETFPKDAIIVSIETSLKSETAKQGSGVVIRVGDRMTTFDHEAEAMLHSASRRIGEYDGEGSVKVQRALMGAGGCEASAFKAHGYRVTGISYPLGAWHNTEDDGSIVSEYIHKDDFRSGVALITEAMRDEGEGRHDDSLRYLASFPETGAMRLRETLF